MNRQDDKTQDKKPQQGKMDDPNNRKTGGSPGQQSQQGEPRKQDNADDKQRNPQR